MDMGLWELASGLVLQSNFCADYKSPLDNTINIYNWYKINRSPKGIYMQKDHIHSMLKMVDYGIIFKMTQLALTSKSVRFRVYILY